MTKHLGVHPDFRLNGVSYDADDLSNHADTLSQSSDLLQKELGLFLTDWLSDSNTIALQTSGSTGAPQQIIADKSKLIASAQATIAFLNLKPKQTALLCLPLKYIGGKMILIRAMVVGLWIDVVSPTANPFQSVNCYDFAAVTPYQLQNSLPDLHKIKQLLVGGAPVSPDLVRAVKGHDTDIYETYGMTETFSHVALKNLSKGESSFTALPGVSFATEDECLVVDILYLSNKPFKTHDVVELISDNRFVWLGRADHVINSGGVKLHPEQIEKQLSKLFDMPLMVFGMPDAALGQSLAVVFEGSFPKGASQIINNTDLLTRYEKPKNLYCLSQFVRRNDKLIRYKTLEELRTHGL